MYSSFVTEVTLVAVWRDRVSQGLTVNLTVSQKSVTLVWVEYLDQRGDPLRF
jgi:hypothetical protein